MLQPTRPPGRELRRTPRTPVATRTPIQILREGAVVSAVYVTVQNFSSNGISFLHSQKLERGERVLVPLASDLEHAARLLHEVAYCRPAGEGLFQVGAEFLSITSRSGDEDVAA